MHVISLEQRSPEWLAWRAVGLGSSDVAALLGVSPWKTRKALLAEKRQALLDARTNPNALREEKVRSNWAMQRGAKLEPVVAMWHAAKYGTFAEPVCAQHSEMAWLRASYDGYDPTFSGGLILEIKVPSRADHLSALEGQIPEKYVPQMRHLFAVAGSHATVSHYVSYNPDMEYTKDRYAVVVTHRNQELDAIYEQINECRKFWQEVLA
jgi:putative phage-type endonuclease